MNAGAYLIVAECAFVALAVGVLALAPPSIVATMGAIPSWSKGLVAALGFITFVWQVFGLVSVAKEKTSLYRTYIRVNFLLTLIIIVVTLAFFAVSASRHSDSVNTCVNTYAQPIAFTSDLPTGSSTPSTQASGRDICNIFIWVQTGVMAGLIALIGLTQLYMCYAQRVYGQKQREASALYKNQPSRIAGDHIPLAARDSAVWEPRNDPYYARDAPTAQTEYPSADYNTYDSYGDDRKHRYNSRYHD